MLLCICADPVFPGKRGGTWYKQETGNGSASKMSQSKDLGKVMDIMWVLFKIRSNVTFFRAYGAMVACTYRHQQEENKKLQIKQVCQYTPGDHCKILKLKIIFCTHVQHIGHDEVIKEAGFYFCTTYGPWGAETWSAKNQSSSNGSLRLAPKASLSP